MTSAPGALAPHRVHPGLGWGLAGLWLLAIPLALAGLGQVPLRDWDESLVARVALEASQRPWPDRLFPVMWGDPYLNKPPGLHLLIAAAIEAWRALAGAAAGALPPEGLVRLVPAFLSSTVVPLVGLVQARLRPSQPRAALASAAIALTLLPLARHGRLAMLDGSQLAAILLLWWAALCPTPPRRSLWWHGLVIGLAGSALLLLKAPLAVPMLGGTLALRAWDRDLDPRQWGWLLVAVAFGLVPGLAWHGAHALVRGPDALRMWLGQGLARLHQGLEGHGGGPAMPLMEVLEGGWPWLALWPGAMGLAWRDRRSRAGRWCLGTSVLTAALVLPLRTQLPWYSLLLWPSLVLCCGPVLVWLVDRSPALKPAWAALTRRVPAFWALLGGLLAALALVAIVTGHSAVGPLAPVAAVGGSGLLAGGLLLLARRRSRRLMGAVLLVLGVWGALLALVSGPLWLWELNESWPVPPVARALTAQPYGMAWLWELEERPSLNWYAGRRVRRWPEPEETAPPTMRTEPRWWLLITAEANPPALPDASCQPLPLPGPPYLFRCLSPGPAAPGG